MKALSIPDWQQLYQSNPQQWMQEINVRLQHCQEETQQSVISQTIPIKIPPHPGPLFGVPYGLKDLFDYQGVSSPCSSRIPEMLQHKASSHAAIVDQLEALGGRCVCKTQMNEFAYGLSGENPHYGNCPHPHLAEHLSGGSSSGSAHIVASGHLPLAIGTDTGGSIRVPAAWCGIYGVRLSPHHATQGAFPLAENLDTIGWFTANRRDMIHSLSSLLQSSDAPSHKLQGSIFLPEPCIDPHYLSHYQKVARALQLPSTPSSHTLLPMLADSNRAFNILQSSEAYQVHEHRLQQYAELYDPAVKDRLLRGNSWNSEEYRWAQSQQDALEHWFHHYFEQHDYLIMPAVPRPAIRPEQASQTLRENMLRLTAPASLSGKPALTIPIALADKQSLGWQIIFAHQSVSAMIGFLHRS